MTVTLKPGPACPVKPPLRRRPAADVYLQLVYELRKFIRLRGLTMQQVDDLAGLNDGHTAHLLHPDTAHGRQASWQTLDLLASAVLPEGFRLKVRPIKKKVNRFGKHTPIDLRPGAVGKTPIRDFAVYAGQKSGEARRNGKIPPWTRRRLARRAARDRAKKLPPSRRSEIAKLAARARWEKERERERGDGQQ